MSALLEQIRQLNEILKKSAVETISFDELMKRLSEILSANMYVADTSGKILSYTTSSVYDCTINDLALMELEFPQDFNEELLHVQDTESNLYTETPQCIYGEKGDCIFKDRYLTIIPISGMGKRLGTFVLAKYGQQFKEDETIVCEYAARSLQWS
jgi:transcriptional pleiotropic repressor